MSRWKCNAPYPGSYLEDGRMIPPGFEFEVPDQTQAREMWIPLDAPARSAVDRAKVRMAEILKEQASEATAQQKNPLKRVFRTLPEHAPAPGQPYSEGRPEDEPVMSPAAARKAL